MPAPDTFSWIDNDQLLAGMARPTSLEELRWLREQGVELIISLTEDPPSRYWINDAGLFLMHVPVCDMTAPTQAQIDQVMSAIHKAHAQKRRAAIHCGAGLGRTGVFLACYLITRNMSADNAIARVRRLRPGSIETDEQEEAIHEFARRHHHSAAG